jgi:hypothetical protein
VEPNSCLRVEGMFAETSKDCRLIRSLYRNNPSVSVSEIRILCSRRSSCWERQNGVDIRTGAMTGGRKKKVMAA